MRLCPISILLIACLTLPAESQSPPPSPQFSRTQLYRALVANKTVDPDRFLTHLSHVCNLHTDVLVSMVNPEGNVLTFKNRGLEISLDDMELNEVPLQPTRKRRAIQ
jgi:hypothetical protein